MVWSWARSSWSSNWPFWILEVWEEEEGFLEAWRRVGIGGGAAGSVKEDAVWIVIIGKYIESDMLNRDRRKDR